MATPVLRRAGWITAAIASGLLLLALALFGERPQTHVGTFQAAGLMKAMPPAEIGWIEVAGPVERRQFRRDGRGWKAVEPGAGMSPQLEERIEQALRLLHNSGPERSLAVERDEEYRAFGLDPPSLQVTVRGRDTLSVAFGTANPLGLARYAHVRGRGEVILIPRYVVDAWEEVLASPSAEARAHTRRNPP